MADDVVISQSTQTVVTSDDSPSTVTIADSVNDPDAVQLAEFAAHSILATGAASATPAAVVIAEDQIVGRAAGGVIVGLTAAQVQAIARVWHPGPDAFDEMPLVHGDAGDVLGTGWGAMASDRDPDADYPNSIISPNGLFLFLEADGVDAGSTFTVSLSKSAPQITSTGDLDLAVTGDLTLDATTVVIPGDVTVPATPAGATSAVSRSYADGNRIKRSAFQINGSRNFVTTDIGKIMESTSASPTVFTIPTDATLGTTDGFWCEIVQTGTGALSVAAAVGVTLRVPTGKSAQARAQYSTIKVARLDENEWVLSGDLA